MIYPRGHAAGKALARMDLLPISPREAMVSHIAGAWATGVRSSESMELLYLEKLFYVILGD